MKILEPGTTLPLDRNPTALTAVDLSNMPLGRTFRSPLTPVIQCRLFFATWVSVAGIVVSASAADISFETERLSQRAGDGAARLEYVFRFQNNSGGPVALEHIEEGCGCLKGRAMFESVDEGGTGEIRGVMDLNGLYGTVAKSMWLRFTNGERHELVAEAVIPPTLVLDPVELAWRKGEEPVEQKVEIRVESGPPLEVSEVACNLPQFVLRLETLEKGRRYILHMRPESSEKELSAVVQVHTTSKNPRDAIRAVFASVSDGKGAAL